MKQASIPLIHFKSLWQWPFVLGLFNSFLIFSLGILYFYWQFSYSNWLKHVCHTRYGPDFLLWNQLFPGSIEIKQLLNILLFYVLFCGLEAVCLTLKSKPSTGLSISLKAINWLARAAMKNLVGLFLLAANLALKPFNTVYLCLSLLSIGLFFWSQRGVWKGYSFSLAQASIHFPSRLQINIVFWSFVLELIIWMLVPLYE